MKRFFTFASAALVCLFAACAPSAPAPTPEPTPVIVSVSMRVSTDNGTGTVIDYMLNVPDGTSLLDAMASQSAKAVADDKGQVTSIEGIPATGDKRWNLTVNGSESNAIAADVPLRNGDKIAWDLH